MALWGIYGLDKRDRGFRERSQVPPPQFPGATAPDPGGQDKFFSNVDTWKDEQRASVLLSVAEKVSI